MSNVFNNCNINNESSVQKVAIYLRLSDEDKNKSNNCDSESIKNQRNLLIEEISKHNNWKLYDEYCDEDLSGAGTYRPEFERLIEDAKNKKIDIILCKSQSRFSRDMEVIEKYLHNKFIEWNIRFISFTDNADTNNIGNKKSRQINGLVNEWYLEDLSNNIRSAFEIKMKKGEYISPFAPYGYLVNPKNNNQLIIDEEVKDIVKKIYNLYLKGFGYCLIAKTLNNEGIPCPSLYKYLKGLKLNIISSRNINDIKWSHNAIKTILTNEIYIGSLIQGKRTTVSYKNKKIIKKSQNKWIRIENSHDALIDRDIWNRVQTNIKKRKRILKKNGMIHVFSNKVFCSVCGYSLKKNSTKKHDYLVCTNTRNEYKNCSNKKSIRYDLLEQIVLDEINKIFEKYFDENELLNNSDNFFVTNYQNTINNLIEEKNALIKEVKYKNNYLKKLYKDRVDGIISSKEFIILQNEYNKKDYKQIIRDIDKKIIEIKSNYKKRDYVIIDKYRRINKLNRVIVDELIDRIEIGSTNSIMNERVIDIKYNF